MYRQGDVLLIERTAIPTGTILHTDCILAYGEATGHHHQVKENGRIWVDVNDHGRRYLEILANTELVHEEHSSIDLKGPAIFEIIIQRSYTPKGIINVID